jgi:polysaccharide pyruvyl transferase CsaB
MKVLVSGYYGFGNAGDELILENILKGLRQNNAGVTVLSASPEKTAEEHGVPAVNRWNPFKVLSALSRADVLLSGGGGLFQDVTGNLSLYYYLLLITCARLFGKKVFIYAAGVNELKRLNSLITARVLNLSSCVTVREQDSYDLLLRWGCNRALLELTADPVLLSGISGVTRHGEKKKIVFIVRPPHYGRWPVDLFARAADTLIERLSAEMVFIPFQVKDDLPFAESIAAAMKEPSRLFAAEKAAAIIEEMRGADLVISQRLHGLILSLVMGIPAIGISDDPKIARFLKETGQKNISGIAKNDPSTVVSAVIETWERREDLKANANRLLPAFTVRARRTSELFFERMG